MTRIVSGLFGGRSASEKILQRFQPVGFSSAGATGSYDRKRNVYSLTRTPERTAAIEGVVSGLNERAANIRALRPQVAPGFGRLSSIRREGLRSRVEALRATGRRTVGNIREQLAQRRLAGSSFQQSQETLARSEFAQAEDLLRADANEKEAQAFLQEIGLTSDLIAQEFDASVQAAQTVLTELNFDTSVVTALAGQTSQLLADNIKAQAEARSAAEAAGEDFLGLLIGAFASGGGAGALPVP